MDSIVQQYSVDGRWMCVADGILSDEECERFIADLDQPQKLETVDRGFALYDRAVMVSGEWAAEIRRRIVGILPEAVRSVCLVIDHFRFSKYLEDGYFDVHRDGVNVDASGNYAIFTVNVFLNSGFGGGQTDFFDKVENRIVRAVPKAGRGAIFDNQIYHCGNPVSGGYKYLLRTDVMIPRAKMVVGEGV